MDDFIWAYMDDFAYRELCLRDLDIEVQNEAVWLWLVHYTSWHVDIYPASFTTHACTLVTDLLFGPLAEKSKTVTTIYNKMADECPDSYCDDDKYLSEAMGFFKDEVALDNFADICREKIFDYLEESLDDHILDRIPNLLLQNEEKEYNHEDKI
tara:strand:- start:6632 stop:7093 length:462 start_codon:yes stop_codon:yes gene_type:complete